MKKIVIAGFVSLAVLAGGCVSTGNAVLKDETRSSVEAKLSKGMTKEQVTAIYGQPLDVSYTDSGNEIWKYAFSKTKMKASSFIPYYGLLKSGSKGDVKTLVLFFDDNGKLVKHSMSTSKIDTNSGLIQ
ncbi:MAG: outer membrane protein assembly factor BamE [Robiginitomaculum sp.]|nr:outer membrane protein assembly factor BamE [Robiginitomaculum sp.]